MFTAAMDNLRLDNRTVTENGCPALCSTGDARVDAFSKLVRGLSRGGLEDLLTKIVSRASVVTPSSEDKQACVDLFTLWANTRDVRGGKGERELSHWMLIWLANVFPETTMGMLPLVPEYGSWRDVFDIVLMDATPTWMQGALVNMVVAQLREDSEEGCTSPSLCAKWAPRPKSARKQLAHRIAHAMFPGEDNPSGTYRKHVAAVNQRLGTVEVAMSSKAWARIQPGSVPARCLKVHRAAFLNIVDSRSTKVRRSAEADRQQCADNFTAHALLAVSDPSKARLHGRVLHPHEMVKPYFGLALEDDLILEAQWTNLRESLRLEMPGLGRMIPLCDVSGSMSGAPMEVAIALSVLISEVSLLRDRFLTFSETPQWHAMEPGWSLRQKVQSAKGAHWGMTTNFEKALDLLLEGCVSGGVPPEEVGGLSLVVLSDMQFDAATSTCYGRRDSDRGTWATQYERLVESFRQAGLASKWGRPYPVPRVIFWNLRGNTYNHPVSASTPGVDCVSGFSPNLLKLFMEGRLDEAATAEVAPNPYDTLRLVLDDPRYAPVRAVCAAVGEGQMAGYTTEE